MRWRALACNKRYSISDTGLVRNKKSRKHVKRYDNGRGYFRVRLYHAKKRGGHWYAVHLLVLVTWDCNRPGADFEGAHQNGNRKDNRLNNLFWKTKKQNTADRVKHCAERKAAKV